MIGIEITKDEFNRVIGTLCRSMEKLAMEVEDVKAVLDTKNAAQWAADTTIDEADINTALSAMNDIKSVIDAYQGEIALSQADRRVFVRRCRGLTSTF